MRWDEMNAGMRRWLRDPEPFERAGEHEPYPGATVLSDLRPENDEQTTLRVLARYTVARLVILWSGGLLAGPKLLTERRVALEHLAMLPTHDWERRALERLAGLCRSHASPDAVMGLLLPAECAAKRGHVMGAFALYRSGYEVSVRKGWWDEAAACAAGIARVAAMYEAPRSRRLWTWRARVLRSRLARTAAEAGGQDNGGAGGESGPSQ